MISGVKSCYNDGMTIKKPMKAPTVADTAAPAAGGATIADRFKLDMPEEGAKKPAAGGVATTCAVVAGLIALAVAGMLTYILWQHWDYLMPA